METLNRNFPLLGHLKCLSSIASFPMLAQNALEVAGSGWVLMGDAAHIVHPLAGQGVNLGFRDVAALAAILKKNPNLKDPALPNSYRQATLSYNKRMSRGFSLIHYFYENAPLAPLRKMGTRYLERMIPLKRELIKLAIGERFKP